MERGNARWVLRELHNRERTQSDIPNQRTSQRVMRKLRDGMKFEGEGGDARRVLGVLQIGEKKATHSEVPNRQKATRSAVRNWQKSQRHQWSEVCGHGMRFEGEGGDARRVLGIPHSEGRKRLRLLRSAEKKQMREERISRCTDAARP